MLKSYVRKLVSQFLHERQSVSVMCIRDVELYPQIPKPAKEGDAGIDLKSAKGVTILPGQTLLVPTGIKLYTGNHAVVGFLIPRSSFSKLGLSVPNSIGVIDSGYQGEIMLAVTNRSYTDKVILPQGERICQMVYTPVLRPVLFPVDSFPLSVRGDTGFGSSGRV